MERARGDTAPTRHLGGSAADHAEARRAGRTKRAQWCGPLVACRREHASEATRRRGFARESGPDGADAGLAGALWRETLPYLYACQGALGPCTPASASAKPCEPSSPDPESAFLRTSYLTRSSHGFSIPRTNGSARAAASSNAITPTRGRARWSWACSPPKERSRRRGVNARTWTRWSS